METVFYNKGGPRAYSSRDRHLLDGISHHGVVRLVLLGRRHDLAEVRRGEFSRRCLACFDAVAWWCSRSSRWIVSAAGEPSWTLLGFTFVSFRRPAIMSSFTEGSYKYATPPVMPLPTLMPVGPRTRTTPFVMYSQQWSPAPSMTACTPLLRTLNLSPDCPAAKNLPEVAPYKHVFPIITEFLASNTPFASASRGGKIERAHHLN